MMVDYQSMAQRELEQFQEDIQNPKVQLKRIAINT